MAGDSRAEESTHSTCLKTSWDFTWRAWGASYQSCGQLLLRVTTRFATLGGTQRLLLMFSAQLMWCSSTSGFLGEKNNTARQQPPLCHESAQEGNIER